MNVLVKDVIIDAVTIKKSKDSSYWMWLKQADLVFVYCTRFGSFGGDVSGKELADWMWWKLPILAKQFMKPEAKMIAQWDDEWAWLFWKGSNWFSNQPETRSPEDFFKETGILDVADENWTVLGPKIIWAKYSIKPVRYMPLPHLWRYDKEAGIADELANKKGIRGMHGNKIALLRHSCVYSSVEHTVRNILEPLCLDGVFFITRPDCSDGILSNKVRIENLRHTNQKTYMDKLRDDCFIGIDDAENYVGWSRFVIECLINYIPCVGSNYATKIFTPELYTVHKDYIRQKELINQLIKNPVFYEQVVRDGRIRVFQHLNSDKLCAEMLRIAREELGIKETEVDVDREIYMVMLDKLLPWHTAPKRPESNSTTFDNYHMRAITQEEWDKLWGRYSRFINDDNIIREVLKRKKMR